MPVEADTRVRTILRDLTGITVVAAVLVEIHVLASPALARALVFDHTQFRVYTLFTSAFVHISNVHLYGNLLGYVLTTVYAYALCLYSGGLRWFRRTFVAVVIAVPVLTSLTSYVFLSWQFPTSAPVSRGFSGVVAGFGGMLLIALYRFVRIKFDRDLAWTVAVSTFLLLMLLIDLRYEGGLSPTVVGLVILGISLVGGSYLAQHGLDVAGREDVKRVAIGAVVVSLVGAVLAVLVLGLFPQAESMAQNGQFTNVFAHAAGFLWGTGITGISHHLQS